MKITLEDVFIELNNSDKTKPTVCVILADSKESTEKNFDCRFILEPEVYKYYWKVLTNEILLKEVIGKSEGETDEFLFIAVI